MKEGSGNEVAGIDAFREGKTSGWVAVVLRQDRFTRAAADVSLQQLLKDVGGVVSICIDMPIGLPTDGRPRACDLAARKFVGPRGSSVFPAPPRKALQAPTYAEATQLCTELTKAGKGMSRQSYGLRGKLFELEPLARSDARIVEVHPEVSFREMAGIELLASKRTWNGEALRRRLLEGQGIALPDQIGEAGDVPSDDVLDAAAAAWSAMRVSAGRALPLPEGSRPGAPMTIWRRAAPPGALIKPCGAPREPRAPFLMRSLDLANWRVASLSTPDNDVLCRSSPRFMTEARP